MITLLILVAWLMPGLATYRRVGYTLESHIGNSPSEDVHEFRGICSACRCKTCGDTWGHHYKWPILGTAKTKQCVANNTYVKCSEPHFRTVLAAPFTLALWPLIVLGYYAHALAVKSGASAPEVSFFKAPKPIESAEAKRERLIVERELEAAERETIIKAKEKELGIGEYRPYTR
jgi:hypothetical protein